MLKYLLITLAALPAFVIATACSGPTTSHGVGVAPSGTTTALTATGAPLPKPINAKLSAADLCKQYIENEAAADETFKGKFIEITGDVVMPVSGGFGSDRFLIISGAGEKSPGGQPFVRCFITDEDQKQSNSLTPGKSVTLRGFCEGRSVDSRNTLLDLKRCTISKIGE